MSSGDIVLHPKLGVNPKVVVCIRCGKDTGDLVLLGRANTIYRCGDCGKNVLGWQSLAVCPNCKRAGHFTKVRELSEFDPNIPMGYCKECEAELLRFKLVVAQGGVYWKCVDCHADGVLKPEAELAKAVRAQMHVDPPKPVGCEFDKTNCPVCGPDKVVEDSPSPSTQEQQP